MQRPAKLEDIAGIILSWQTDGQPGPPPHLSVNAPSYSAHRGQGCRLVAEHVQRIEHGVVQGAQQVAFGKSPVHASLVEDGKHPDLMAQLSELTGHLIGERSAEAVASEVERPGRLNGQHGGHVRRGEIADAGIVGALGRPAECVYGALLAPMYAEA